MEPLDLLERASAESERIVSAVPADKWSAPSPCSDWDTRAVVHHLIAGNLMAVGVLSGASREDAVAGIVVDGELSPAITSADPVARLVETNAAQLDAFRAAAGDPERIVHHPRADIPVSMFFSFRIGDLTLHAWDLARAAGLDEDLDKDLVEGYWAALQPLLPILTASGAFGDGASGTVPDDAPTQTRLLDAAGRRP